VLKDEFIDNKFLLLELWETERMIIRDTNIEDVGRIQEIYMQSRSTEGWTRDDELTNDYIINGFNRGNLPPNGMKEFYKIQSITYKDTSEIIGFMEFYHGYPEKDVLYILTLLFCEGYRNNRYGQESINELCRQATELGFFKARLVVTLKNWQGIYFWTKLGFNTILKYCGDKVFAKDSFAVLELGKDLTI